MIKNVSNVNICQNVNIFNKEKSNRYLKTKERILCVKDLLRKYVTMWDKKKMLLWLKYVTMWDKNVIEAKVMYSYGPPHMAVQKQDNQLELTYSNYVRTQGVILKTCRRR